MKIRHMGLLAKVAPALKAVQDTGAPDVIQADGPYPNRGDSRMVRAYIKAQPHPDGGAVP